MLKNKNKLTSSVIQCTQISEDKMEEGEISYKTP